MNTPLLVPPGSPDTIGYYQRNAARFIAATAGFDNSALLVPFMRSVVMGGHVLDAGCGSGRDGAVLARSGFRVTAIDGCAAMVDAANALGLNASVRRVQEIDDRGVFDGVWAEALMLHVPHSEVPDVISRFATALTPVGSLFVSVKEGNGESVAPDGRFFSYFSQSGFEKSIEDTGRFDVRAFWPTTAPDSGGKEQTWLNFIARRR